MVLQVGLSGCREMFSRFPTRRSSDLVHLGMVSLEVAVGANEMNHIIKRFSAVATIVLPLTLVAGLFGMNVEVPGQFAEPLWLWFYVIVGAFALISIAMIMLFRYLEWL